MAWTKGHITDDQVRAGTHTAEAKTGNDLADTFADIGAEGYGAMVGGVAGKWAKRQAAYANLMGSIHKHILKVMRIDRERRKVIEKVQAKAGVKGSNHNVIHVAAVLPYAKEGCVIDLAEDGAERRCKTNAEPALVEAVWSFLNNLKVQPIAAGTPGITWLELLFLFEINGGGDFLPKAIRGGKRAPTISQRVSIFKQAASHVVRTCARLDQQDFFKAVSSRTNRLGVLGFTGKVPTIRMLPEVKSKPC